MGGGEKAEVVEGVAAVLDGREDVENRLLNAGFCAPCCGVGCAYWVAEEGAAVEMEL